MVSRRIAHLSDLHIGAASEEASEWLVQAVLRSGAERVAITGDVTHRGRAAGLELLRRVRHRCDVVLHGHRHAPAELRPFSCEAPLRVFNGGSSTELQAFRVFDVDGGRVDTCWIDARAAANEPPRVLSRAA